MEHGGGPRKEEAYVSRYCPDQLPQTGHRTVVGNRKVAYYDRANSTMGNQMGRGLREKERQVYGSPQRMQE